MTLALALALTVSLALALSQATLESVRETSQYNSACSKEPQQRTESDLAILRRRTAHLDYCNPNPNPNPYPNPRPNSRLAVARLERRAGQHRPRLQVPLVWDG